MKDCTKMEEINNRTKQLEVDINILVKAFWILNAYGNGPVSEKAISLAVVIEVIKAEISEFEILKAQVNKTLSVDRDDLKKVTIDIAASYSRIIKTTAELPLE